MNPESISRNEILSLARQLLRKDKELLLFSFFYVAFRAGTWIFYLWAMYTLVHSALTAKTITLWQSPLIIILVYGTIYILTGAIHSFYYALTVQCVGDRLEGGNPTFFSTIAKISHQWRTILRIHLRFFQPLPFKYFSVQGSAREFLFQEILLNNKTYEEALERTASYVNSAWARDLLFSLRWSALMIAFFLLGALIPAVGFGVLMTKLIPPLVAFFILKICFYATILYYGGYFVYTRALSHVYETVLYEKYVKNAVFEKTNYSLVIKVNGTEKTIPL